MTLRTQRTFRLHDIGEVAGNRSTRRKFTATRRLSGDLDGGRG
ncbi:hypothetical protein [Arthrobacter sp. R1-13]